MSDINDLRNKMDAITLEMINLLKTRTDIAKEIGEIKKNIGKGVTDEEREDNLRGKILQVSKEIGLDETIASKFLNFLLNESIKVQSENNDLYTMKRGKVITKTNNSGGILGGISNGMPITMRIAFKPASSIAQKQETVDIKNKKDAVLQVKGRHDPCVVPRAAPVVDSLVALTIADHALITGAIKPSL